jgi:phage shock protein C
MQDKRLTRSANDRMVAGVCAGLATYFGIDPVFVRLAVMLLALFNGVGLILYIVAWVLIPSEHSVTADPQLQVRENLNEIQGAWNDLIERIRSFFQSPSAR